jgi:Carbohydrate esterase, sialic acid-specific acetylesterase/Immunoglobulin I-set domain
MKQKLKLHKKITPNLGQLKCLVPSIGLAVFLGVVPLAGCGGGDSSSAPAPISVPTSTPNPAPEPAPAPSPAPAPAPAPVITAPAITAQPANITVTELQSASFSVTAMGGAPLSYQWRRNGAAIAGATSATLTISSALAADHSAKYSAVVTNSAGSVTSTEAVLTQELPMFLMAGQSNMEGNVDTTLLQSLLTELASSATTDTIKTNLAELIRSWHVDANNGYAKYGYTPQMSAFEASELVRLKAAGLVGANLTTPNPKVFCAWNLATVSQLVFSTLPTKCGGPGPELVFGQALSKAGYSSTSLIKVAVGGTNLYSDWRSPLSVPSGGKEGYLYTQLRSRIQSLKATPASVNASCTTRACKWSAFVWFQGEADSDNNPQRSSANADAYEQNLKNLIADVRKDAGSPTLPVVIVQTGAWAQTLAYGKTIAAAQIAVVNADKYARIVTTSDLSGFYHYDPAAQFIIGERVGLAVQSLLAAAPAPK